MLRRSPARANWPSAPTAASAASLAASAAPKQLASYLAMNRGTQVRQIMDKLAEFRKILNSEDGFIISNDEHKLIALEICLKCADIGHSAKKLSIHKVWTA